MRPTLVILSLCVLFIVSELSAFDVSSTDIIGETAGVLDKAKEIFNSIKESDFYKTVQSVKKWGLPLFSSINTVVKIIKSYTGGDSKQVAYLKKEFSIINEKMDYVDMQFESVKRLMDWNVIKIQFQRYESSVGILKDKISILIDAEGSVKDMLTTEFVRNYEQIYGNAAENIYMAFVNPNLIFTENLISAIRKYTQEDQGKVEKFFLGNIQLLFKALEVEAFYMNFKNFTSVQPQWEAQWDKNMKELTDIMTQAVEVVKECWKKQSDEDIETFNGDNAAKSVEEYAKGLYTFLSDKFKSREWMVLVYDPLTDDKDHSYHNCDGVTQMQRRGKNILVNSVAKGESNFDKNRFTKVCSGIPTKLLSWGHGPAFHLLSRYVGNNCNGFKISAVIRSKSAKYFVAVDSHFATCRWAGWYNRFVDVHKTLDVIVMG